MYERNLKKTALQTKIKTQNMGKLFTQVWVKLSS